MREHKYTYQKYDAARWYIAEGMYSIKELEEMIEEFALAETVQDAALKKSMQHE